MHTLITLCTEGETLQHVIIKVQTKKYSRNWHKAGTPPETTQPAQYVGPMSIPCWSSVYDVGPRSDQHRANALGRRGGSNSNPKMAQIRMTFQGIVNSSWKITVDLNSP